MKKWMALLAALLAMSLLLVGCGEQDPEKVAATKVAEVNGEIITLGEAQTMYTWMVNQYVGAAQQNGESIDTANKTFISNMKAQVLGVMTEGLALEQRLEKEGQGLTEEDRATIQSNAQQEFDYTTEQLMSQYGLTKEVAEQTATGLGYSLDAYVYMLTRMEIENRVASFVDRDTPVTDEEIQARYDTNLETQKTTYAETPGQFVQDYVNGNVMYYQPEGFRFVKNIVIPMNDDTNAQYTQLDEDAYALLLELITAQNQMSTNTEMTDEEKAELETKIAGLNADMEALQEKSNTIRDEGHAAIQARADEALAKAKEEGADFDAVLKEYGTDAPPLNVQETGYPVNADTTSYVTEFTTAAMALENIGDISDLVASDYGYHILKYASDVPAGDIPLSELTDVIRADLQTEKYQQAVNAKLVEWIDAANIKTHIERF